MSADGSVTISWPDDERKYRLGIGELRELQDKCDAGPAQIFKRLSDSSWRYDDVRETIRLGLIGAGENPQRALALVARHVAPGNLMPAVAIAQTILYAALIGDPNDIVGKAKPETTTAEGGSPSRDSMETEPSSGGPLATSINAHSSSSLPQ